RAVASRDPRCRNSPFPWLPPCDRARQFPCRARWIRRLRDLKPVGTGGRINISCLGALGFLMAGIALRQVRAVIAVCEGGSFTLAAERETAPRWGVSQHVAAVERALKVKLFERTSTGVVPTPAGLRYYRRCVEAVGLLDTAGEEARALASFVTGE